MCSRSVTTHIHRVEQRRNRTSRTRRIWILEAAQAFRLRLKIKGSCSWWPSTKQHLRSTNELWVAWHWVLFFPSFSWAALPSSHLELHIWILQICSVVSRHDLATYTTLYNCYLTEIQRKSRYSRVSPPPDRQYQSPRALKSILFRRSSVIYPNRKPIEALLIFNMLSGRIPISELLSELFSQLRKTVAFLRLVA